VLPRIVVAARRDDALARLLSGSGLNPSYSLEFCARRDAIVERVRLRRPAALIVALRGDHGVAEAALVRHVKQHCPQVPVVVACSGTTARGGAVLETARAGAEHFAFTDVDDFGDVLRALLQPPPPEEPGRAPISRANGDSSLRKRSLSTRARGAARALPARQRRASIPVEAALTPMSPLLRRIVNVLLRAIAPAHVDELAAAVGLPRRTLLREMARRGWPPPHVLLRWGRLLRGAVAANNARSAGVVWEESRDLIARAAGYGSARAAQRAFRALAGVGLQQVWHGGVAAILAALCSATGTRPPSTRMAS
jgi:hypothetical protein